MWKSSDQSSWNEVADVVESASLRGEAPMQLSSYAQTEVASVVVVCEITEGTLAIEVMKQGVGSHPP